VTPTILIWRVAALSAGIATGAPLLAQASSLDRADPTIVQRQRPTEATTAEPAAPRPHRRARPTDAVGPGSVLVGAVRVVGADGIPPEAFAPAFAPYLGRRFDPEGLRRLAGAIADVARTQGYVFATASIPPQKVASGILRIAVDLGHIDDVRVIGTDNAALRRMLGVLADGTPMRTDRLERQLLIAGDIPGIRIGRTSFAREGDRGVLIVRATEDRAAMNLVLDNRGSHEIGPERLRTSTDFRGLLSSGDELTIETINTPFQPREFTLIGANYTMLLGNAGTDLTVGGFYGRSRPAGVLRGRNIQGRSIAGSITATHPLLRSRRASLWLSGEFDSREIVQDQRGSRLRTDRLTTATTTLSGSSRSGAGASAAGSRSSRAWACSTRPAPATRSPRAATAAHARPSSSSGASGTGRCPSGSPSSRPRPGSSPPARCSPRRRSALAAPASHAASISTNARATMA
jgi:hemolysin activation/secretion protein